MTPENQAALDKLRATAAEAEQAYRTVTAARKARIEAATAAINEEYREQTAQLSLASMTAEAAVTRAISDFAGHEWDGKKVTRNERKSRSPFSSKTSEVAIFGVVEVRRKDTEFPANLSRWRYPDMGAAYVRLLKKDGTPGKTIERLISTWKLVEGEDA